MTQVIKTCSRCDVSTTRQFICLACGAELPLTEEERSGLKDNKVGKRILRKARKLIKEKR